MIFGLLYILKPLSGLELAGKMAHCAIVSVRTLARPNTLCTLAACLFLAVV